MVGSSDHFLLVPTPMILFWADPKPGRPMGIGVLFWGPLGDGIINGTNNEKQKTRKKCSIWQLVKNWLDGDDRNHILRQYSPRIWTIPFDKMAKS